MSTFRKIFAASIVSMFLLVLGSPVSAGSGTCLPIVGCVGGYAYNGSNTSIEIEIGEPPYWSTLGSGQSYGGWNDNGEDVDKISPMNGHTIDLYNGMFHYATLESWQYVKYHNHQRADCYGNAPSLYCYL